MNVEHQVNQFKTAIEQENAEGFGRKVYTIEEGAKVDFMPKILQRYCNNSYSVYKDLPEDVNKKLEMFGIVILKNDITGNFEIIKISKNNLRA